MQKRKAKKARSRSILLLISIVFILLLLAILMLSITSFIYSDTRNIHHECNGQANTFMQWLSKFDIMSDPISIFLRILTSIGGVFFGIRIAQWIDDRRNIEQLCKLWQRINIFLREFKSGIANADTSIFELAEYKMYWDALQRADNIATKYLQEDARYIEISFAFSFLTFYRHSWEKYACIDEWRGNAPDWEEKRITKWMESFDDLIYYTESMTNTSQH